MKVAIASVFGDPLQRRTWSGAPLAIAEGLRHQGFDVGGIHSALSRPQKAALAAQQFLHHGRRALKGEIAFRALRARHWRADRIAAEAAEMNAGHVLHTGTLDMPPRNGDGPAHSIYCDHTLDLAARHGSFAKAVSDADVREWDRIERACYDSADHIFTFTRYVAQNLVEAYGLPPSKVSCAGAGYGPITPYSGPKDYANGPLLFVAKHLFVEKGGLLLLEAYDTIRRHQPHRRLVIVGDPRHAGIAGQRDGVEFHSFLSLAELQSMYERAALLVQPMLNDPWGQVYLEAMVCRTPVVGLDRNGLPELTENGRFGFLCPEATPQALAETVIDALSDLPRLEAHGVAAQAAVAGVHSWEAAAAHIAAVLRHDAKSASGQGNLSRGLPLEA
jgi:glycosyltransferase involved in cell wall biosynthesis